MEWTIGLESGDMLLFSSLLVVFNVFHRNISISVRDEGTQRLSNSRIRRDVWRCCAAFLELKRADPNPGLHLRGTRAELALSAIIVTVHGLQSLPTAGASAEDKSRR